MIYTSKEIIDYIEFEELMSALYVPEYKEKQ